MLGKDYVPAAPMTASPNESPSPSATSPGPTASPAEESATASDEEKMDDDFIGPPLDARATDHEQWIVSVEMVSDLKKIDVRLERTQWEALQPGDRVHVVYRQGKYTGTVWSAKIE